MQKFFTPRSIAVIGVSSNPDKVGHVIYSHVLKKFKSYAVNNKRKKILGKKTYLSVLDIKDNIDLGIIAVPAKFVLETVEQCGKKGIKHLIIVTSGFKEIGNERLEHELHKILDKYKIKCIGPNCLGSFDAHSGLDTLFLPTKKLTRPKPGSISFISQSGAVGSTILDKISYEHVGFAKFISYGNAVNLDETDYLEFLGKDKQTKVICIYLEGIKDGRKFLNIARKIKKPIILIKAGRSETGQKATMSHTGSLAGSYVVHKGAFKQGNVIMVESIRDMFNVARLFDKLPAVKNKNVQVITNGGGFGIITADALESHGINLAKLSSITKTNLKEKLSELVTISNPIDLVGDVTNERYALAVNACMKDKNVGVLAIVVLTQTPLIDKKIVNVIKKHKGKKPIIILSLGGEQTKKVAREFEKSGFPVFEYPEDAASALQKYLEFYF